MHASRRGLAAVLLALALVVGTAGAASAATGDKPTTVGYCGWLNTQICVTFGHAATRKINGAASDGVVVFVGVLCAEIPSAPPILLALKAACAGAAAGYYAALKQVFAQAVAAHKRVRIGWLWGTVLPVTWKVVA